MNTLAKEPDLMYGISPWLIKTETILPYLPITKVEINSIFIYQPMNLWADPELIKKEFKISSLRGRLSKQKEEDVDKEIDNLRKEWERNI